MNSQEKIGSVLLAWAQSFSFSMADLNELLTTASTLVAICYTVYRYIDDKKEKKNEKEK